MSISKHSCDETRAFREREKREIETLLIAEGKSSVLSQILHTEPVWTPQEKHTHSHTEEEKKRGADNRNKGDLVLSSQVPETEPVYRTKHNKNSWKFPFRSFSSLFSFLFFGKLTHMPIAGDHSWCYWVLLFFLFSVCCSLFFSLMSKQNTNRTK